MKTFMKALGVFLLIPFFSQAQTDEDALRYSQLNFGGTARFMGLSGAFGALGADFGSLSSNPAGIGLYRNSEFNFTPAVTNTHMEANYLGNLTSDNTTPFNIASMGMVFSSDLTRKHPDNKWKRINFAFGANRLNDYNSQTFFTGFNSSNSLTEYYVAEANQGGGVAPSQITSTYPFSSGMFYQAYLINPEISDSFYYSTVVPGGGVQQTGYILQDGSTTEYLFSIGSNYDDHLLIGMTLGMPFLFYHSTTTFSEDDVDNAVPDFNSFTFTNYLHTYGTGINGKFGATYIINDVVRVGAAIHTPTYYWMHDDYSAFIQSSLNSIGGIQYPSIPGTYNYDLVTPWRLIGSVAAYYKKYGFISLDYEMVDYGSMDYIFNRYGTPDELTTENVLNQTINQKYRVASNIRLGAEFAHDIFRFRAGAAYYGSPFQSGAASGDNDFSRLSFSGGVGVRGEHAFFDAGYVHTTSQEFYQPYTLENQDVPGVALRRSVNNFLATVGFKF